MKNINWAKVVRWLVVLAMPFLLTLGTLRLIIVWNSPSYPSFEYGRIAPDRYGFTDEERLELAEATLGYLRSSEPADEAIRLLEELRLPGGDQPLYNEREIGHMLDVKELTDLFSRLIWVGAIVVIGGLLYLLLKGERRKEGYRALMQGGLFTTGSLLVVIVLIGLSWNFVFTQFHEILFPPDTWTFHYSDSLIRLFPERFWFDFGLLWTGAVFLEGIVLAILGYWLLRRSG
ncbi:MAG: TIGR01906 family membrane protein [Chloroflexota bacterium]|nr:MAG: TIGR01906 family membrane protein [Chloroflexota bacterium]